nr:5639_t:CDS:2 [Entrophospora candida]
MKTMKITKLQLGKYANQQSFCLYLFPSSPSSVVSSPKQQKYGQNTSSRALSTTTTPTTIYQPFYKLRDIDIIFFESSVGHISNSGKIPQIYFDTPGYCFYERSSGEMFLAACALSETASRLGNHLLVEFCKLGKPEILSGMADRLLDNVPISRVLPIEDESELLTITDPNSINQNHASVNQKAPIRANTPTTNIGANLNYSSIKRNLSPPISGRKRIGVSTMNQQVPSPTYFGTENSNPSSPNYSPHLLHSPSSPSPITNEMIDDDVRMRKRRRVAVTAIGSNNIKVTNNPESKRSSRSKSNRNSRNLSVIAPPYVEPSNFASSAPPHIGSIRGLNSAGITKKTPLTAPIISFNKSSSITNTTTTRNNVSGYSLVSTPRSTPTDANNNNYNNINSNIDNSNQIATHSASTSANINGLISPQNIDDISPSSSRSDTPRTATSKSFINLFDTFYDTIADSHSLKSTLEEQINKTTALLQTLQASGSMIEGLVRGHFHELQREVIKDLMALEKRITRVEECMKQNSVVSGMNPSPPLDPERRLSDISTKDYEDLLSTLKARLESLERRMSVS